MYEEKELLSISKEKNKPKGNLDKKDSESDLRKRDFMKSLILAQD